MAQFIMGFPVKPGCFLADSYGAIMSFYLTFIGGKLDARCFTMCQVHVPLLMIKLMLLF